jgi:hypothetical protein
MAGEPIHDYLEAKSKLDTLTHHIDEMVTTLRIPAGALHDWRRVTVGGAGGFSLAMATARDVAPWPSEAFRAALQEWRRVRLDAVNCWNRVPHEKRSGLRSPEGR